jgi:hypothetical protein
VRQKFLEVGRKARKPAKKQLLKFPFMEERLSWARKYKEWSAETGGMLFLPTKQISMFSDTHRILLGAQ